MLVKITLPDSVVDIAVKRLFAEEIVMSELAPEFGVHRNTLAKCIKNKVSYSEYAAIAKRGMEVGTIRSTRTQRACHKEKKTPAELKQLYNQRYVFLKQTEKEVVSEKARKEIALIKRVLEVMREIILDENYVQE